jgi:hypothetical protein
MSSQQALDRISSQLQNQARMEGLDIDRAFTMEKPEGEGFIVHTKYMSNNTQYTG